MALLPFSEVSFEEKPSRPLPDPMKEEEEEEEEDEEMARIQKKVAMSLDDLIKMSRKDDASKGRRRKRGHRRRSNNKGGRGYQLNDGANAPPPKGHGNDRGHRRPNNKGGRGYQLNDGGNAPSPKGHGNDRVQRYMDSRSTIRQGVLAQRRSRSVATTVQRKVTADGTFSGEDKVQTLDALFASMKEQRMRAVFQKEEQQHRHDPRRQQSIRAVSQQQQHRHDRRQQRKGRPYARPNSTVQTSVIRSKQVYTWL